MNRAFAGYNISYTVAPSGGSNSTNYTNSNYVSITQPANQPINFAPGVPGANMTIFQASFDYLVDFFILITQDSATNLWIQLC